jgi:hypothetical protein
VTDHDRAKLAGCHPDLIARLDRVLAGMQAAGFPMMVTDGKRTAVEQAALYAQGRTAPGHIVTYADGVMNLSNHQSGRAADSCFVVDGAPSWAVSLPWHAYGALVVAVGLVWGGDWHRLVDLPHAELP